MVSDTIYELCSPVLLDAAIAEEDKAERLEDLLRKELGLSGHALEDAVLGVLWKHRGVNDEVSTPPPIRATVIRRPSPAPWQVQRSGTPSAPSPRSLSHNTTGHPAVARPGFMRTKSSTASPSPRPSPRLAYATPQIPHSPSLSTYQFSDHSPTNEVYDDYGSDNVNWLVNDDASSTSSYAECTMTIGTAAADYMQPVNVDMSPYDMIRSVLREDRSDDDLAKLLEANGWDLSQTLIALMGIGSSSSDNDLAPHEQGRTYLVGKSMLPSSRPVTPAGQAKSPIVCRYILVSGHCSRADCRFSHDLNGHMCKYFLKGHCLAGDSCVFSHDPTELMAKMNLDNNVHPDPDLAQSEYQVSDCDSFPVLQPTTSNPYESDGSTYGSPQPQPATPVKSTLNPFANFVPSSASRPNSRPASRQASRTATPSAPSLHDDEAFPTLGSAATARSGKRHHGKRGHGHGSHRDAPSSLAEVVRMSPMPSPVLQPRKGLRPTRSFTGSRENSPAARAIPAPEHVPWLETGDNANRAYLKARGEALRHGGLRNKFLQSAAQAWNRNDARGAKALSLRGQNENTLMKEAHQQAARVLYDERNKNAGSGKELYVDLHGLHPDEAVQYLNTCLLEHKHDSRPVYAICGTGHHSKNGKDKVGKGVRVFLNEWRYAFQEFSVPGDRNNVGGILGIDPTSFDRGLAHTAKETSSEADSGVGLVLLGQGEDTKVRIIKTEEAS